MSDADLVERLVAHRMIGSAPREQLEWLASRGELHRFTSGDEISNTGKPLRALYVILSGHVTIYVDRGAGPKRVMEWHGGDISGLLPYSRLGTPPGRVDVLEPTEILMVDRDHFPEMINRCHELTAIFVHVMLDRARRFTSSDLHDEKMISLGRLSAGIAHELNNPASALARGAKELAARLAELEASALALGAQGLSGEQLTAIARVRSLGAGREARASLSPLDRADLEEAVTDWLSRRGLEPEVAEALAEASLTVETLDQLRKTIGDDALVFALHSIGASARARRLASEMEVAATRIHSLVAGIKGFTYMDQTGIRKPVDIGQGLHDTMVVLGGKARRKSVTVDVKVAEDLPQIEGFGGELNQVWANLIDNAIDAVPESGHIEVSAANLGDRVVVRVVDNGPGVPKEIKEQIFDPFFTTKPQGQGTGLGLDIARRLIREHDGQIDVESSPGRTEFRVILPRA